MNFYRKWIRVHNDYWWTLREARFLLNRARVVFINGRVANMVEFRNSRKTRKLIRERLSTIGL